MLKSKIILPLVIIAALLTMPSKIKCQTVKIHMTDGKTKWYEPLPVPHKTADKAFYISTAASLLATGMDVENSVVALRKPGTAEFSFPYGRHPTRAGYYAVSLPVAAVLIYMSYRYKREDDALKAAGLPGHRFVKWWVPNAINTGMHVFGTLVTLASTHR